MAKLNFNVEHYDFTSKAVILYLSDMALQLMLEN